ncbi:MAG TPA: DUF4255 domain-containing protein [Acidimicrobiales bacterium]|nr:DUF4255 domain-containing protein [Acidimicrobiales bacterium]
MIHYIDEAIEALLRREVPLPETSVDISFAAPDRAWGAGVTRPTINVFLWDVRRNAARVTAGLAEQSATTGQVSRRPSSPVVDLRYLVTAWAAEHRDEHQLLGSVLRCVLANPGIPPDTFPPQLTTSGSLSLSLASEEARVPGEFWSSLDGRLKPGLQIVVALPLDVFSWVTAGPPATSVAAALQRLEPDRVPDVNGSGQPSDVDVALRRRRSSGVLTMEGRMPPGVPGAPGAQSPPPPPSGPGAAKASENPSPRRGPSTPGPARPGGAAGGTPA